MKYEVSELEGHLLDAAVGKCEGAEVLPGYLRWPEPASLDIAGAIGFAVGSLAMSEYHPSSDWADGGRIIEREGIALEREWVQPSPDYVPDWYAAIPTFQDGENFKGKTPLVAAMRAYVTSKFGDMVDIP